MLDTPTCFERKCKYYIGVKSDGEGEENERNVCDAFPDGIPDEIAYGENKHLTPLSGQKNEIVYERE